METLGFVLMFGAISNFILLLAYTFKKQEVKDQQYVGLVIVGTLCIMFIDLITFVHGLSMVIP